jgi:hypothetical protein
MAFTVKDTPERKSDPMPAGLHVGRCYMVIDVGTHHDEMYGKDRREVILGWEVPDERIKITKDGEEKDLPRVVSKKFTASLSDKATLRKFLEAWRGKEFTKEELAGFDLKNILGIPCQLLVTHKTSSKGNPYAALTAVMPIGKGMTCAKQENPDLWYAMEENTPIPEAAYDWIKEEIMSSQEWVAQQDAAGMPHADDPVADQEDSTDSLPF